MKKILLAGVAAVALTAAGVSAQAQEVSASAPFKVTVGGVSSVYGTGLLSKDKQLNKGGQQNALALSTGSRLLLGFEAKADNGLVYGGKFNLNTSGSTSNPGLGDKSTGLIDTTYGYVQGKFGEVRFGSNGGASDTLAVGPSGQYSGGVQNTPGINGGIACYGGSAFKLACDYAWMGATATAHNNASKLLYLSPTFSGLQLGVSFAPDGKDKAGANAFRNTYLGKSETDGTYNQAQAGINYKTMLGGNTTVNLGAGLNHEQSKQAEGGTPVNDVTQWAVNGLVKYAGFEVGLGYGSSGDSANPKDYVAKGDQIDSNWGAVAWVDYGIGNWNVGGYYQALRVQEDTTTLVSSRTEIGELGASYTITKGLGVYGGLDLVSSRSNATDSRAANSQMLYLGTAVFF